MKSRISFTLILAVVGFIFLQIPINKLAGSKVSFTLFDLFAPISGAVLGSFYGVIAVFAVQGVNLLMKGLGNADLGSLIRLFPTLFAVLYFALSANKKSKNYILFVPLISIIIFNLHPIGRTVWFYSLFWFIPVLMWPLRSRFLFARALGSTFCAHSVGGAAWIWAFSLPATVWVSLIPIIVMERLIFALGISASYILVNNVLVLISIKKLLPKGIRFNKKYVYLNLK